MVIDMSYNYINNYTNIIPVSVEQLTETPDPRYFYLNNNNLTYFSDLLLEQYGACSTLNPLSTAYFIVGISNVLLTNNPLICDCQSYHLITYIKFNIDDFPEIDDGSALITEATCSVPIGEKYILTNFNASDNCENYTLPNMTNIFCSLDGNNATVTLAPPTYSLSTTTTNGYETTGSTVSFLKHELLKYLGVGICTPSPHRHLRKSLGSSQIVRNIVAKSNSTVELS